MNRLLLYFLFLLWSAISAQPQLSVPNVDLNLSNSSSMAVSFDAVIPYAAGDVIA